ncbi:response regulator transcription factor [Arenicella xantha]|uniref:DNA-binding response OmpR family regulator n=1 Tax=Arenicella xantha TaxID=644221 RepID=A0A395JHV5_9GAMM|nr:response regulator transcription factor [Arenicella xantha]RBP49253.1 DNA-binding response OmpR family regulator [Arenicella xantha]
MRIVILEDDRDQADLLVAWLQEAGHLCDVFNDGNAFIRAYSKESYDLVLLDWMVPSLSGIEVLQHLRSQLDPVVPVVFITQRNAEEDIVEALEAGADDFMSKPVRHNETLARVNAIARRMGFGDANTSDDYDFPPYKIDTRLRQVSKNAEPIELTQKEYELTLFLFKNLGRVISRGHLLELVWGTSSKLNTRTVDTHVSRLRSKLDLDAEPTWQLTSVYRHGYRLENTQ